MILYYSSADAQGTAPVEQQSELQPMQGAGQTGTANMGSANMDEAAMAQALDVWLAETPDNEILLSVYNEYIDGASYADNMKSSAKSAMMRPHPSAFIPTALRIRTRFPPALSAIMTALTRLARLPIPTMWPY